MKQSHQSPVHPVRLEPVYLMSVILQIDKTETLSMALRVSKNVADVIHRLRRNPPIEDLTLEHFNSTLFPKLEKFDCRPPSFDPLGRESLQGHLHV